jgi:hypothetical protein
MVYILRANDSQEGHTVGDVAAVIGMPVCVLSPRGGVEVENSIHAVFGADVDDAVEVFEAGLFEDPWVHVVF